MFTKNRFVMWFAIALGMGAIIGGCYHLLRFDPKITNEHLQGRTSAQVVAELGEPGFRFGGPPNEAEDGPLRFEYAGPFYQRYGVWFENDKVVKVNHANK